MKHDNNNKKKHKNNQTPLVKEMDLCKELS